jgi:hypothetical protein
MRIYNYLFYKSYLLAKRSRNFDDIPALGGIIFVVACLMFNIFTITILLDSIGVIDEFPFRKEYKFVFSILLVAIVLLYYLYNGKYKKIIEHYEKKNVEKVQLHPVVVIVVYYLISFGLLLLAGMYKNHDWIFA